jgi:hypothetical protein
MIERIKRGAKPTEIFREMFSNNLGLSNYELGTIFHAHFKRISGEAVQAIWYWKSGRSGQKSGGYTDDQLDAFLLRMLEKAGYLWDDGLP